MVTTRSGESSLAAIAPAKSICESIYPPKIFPAGFVSLGIATIFNFGSPISLIFTPYFKK